MFPGMDEQPSNGELLKEIKSVHTILQGHEDRLKELERWKIAYDAAMEAVKNYKQEHQEVTRRADALFGGGVMKDFVNVVLKFLGLITTLLGILYLVVEQLVK